MEVKESPRIHLGTEVAAEGGKGVSAALIETGVDAKALKGLESELDAFAKAGVSPQGIGEDQQFASIMKLVEAGSLARLLGKDGYVNVPGDATYMIANRAFLGSGFLDRVLRDTGIKYNTMVGGGSPVPGCTWMTVSNPQPKA